ncbi:4-alpha-glucanotransferase [Coriobacterium glomerans PW2]|uniref:4-alpha-glucanotransferase n=1 Tax=Coriobacterium glomerans (strain ATCC 49209 / DSM 20642 / JCM 10262 / PW2) TaxID=700015 RepID=F2N8D2_CORGP|nr:4-alpha-glucanotransferase [Coriobacterium glomerans]AEB07315.1 4-alpha-glucanotransferase [Coriobacterium glomerans PW2]
MRCAGILMPVSSLPSKRGIGTLGDQARRFIDFLVRSGQSAWQILPIVPTGYGDSPYQSFSSFAGNPYLIDLDDLADEGLICRAELDRIDWGADVARVDYEALYRERFAPLRAAVERLGAASPAALSAFTRAQASWLDDYALFMAIKDAHGGAAWSSWEPPLRFRQPAAIHRVRSELADGIAFWKGVQFLFFRQWARLAARAATADVAIIGDLPIYVAWDSADVWAHPEQFQLDAEETPIEVAGCPPDGFSAEGQRWGNPLFDWDRMRAGGYRWWIDRIAYQLRLFDVLRIDHYRGFDSYYAIPRASTTARGGRWRKGPGIEFFRALKRSIGEGRIIAEDLGFTTASVRHLLAQTGYPGMKVLQFAFDSRDGDGGRSMPGDYPRNCVAYVGTHDNDTVLGWLESAPAEDVVRARASLFLDADVDANWAMMRAIWNSPADTAIVQMQDVLGLDGSARMNTPSTLGGNWTWRALPGFASDDLAERLHCEMERCGRLPDPSDRHRVAEPMAGCGQLHDETRSSMGNRLARADDANGEQQHERGCDHGRGQSETC